MGSEMCIRDSINTLQTLTGQPGLNFDGPDGVPGTTDDLPPYFAIYDLNGVLALEPAMPMGYDPANPGAELGPDGIPGTPDDGYEFTPGNDTLALAPQFATETDVLNHLGFPNVRGEVPGSFPTQAPPLPVYLLNENDLGFFAQPSPTGSWTPGPYAFTESYDPASGPYYSALYLEPVTLLGPGPDGATGTPDDEYEYTGENDGLRVYHPTLADLQNNHGPEFDALVQIGGVPYGSDTEDPPYSVYEIYNLSLIHI